MCGKIVEFATTYQETHNKDRNYMTRILLLPGASATGRDYLLEKLLGNPEVVGVRLGLDRPVRVKVARKTTTRPSRTVELLKRCVEAEEFAKGESAGEIIASYVLESNGHKYGYHRDDLQPDEEADLLVTDASVYQIPQLKQVYGNRVHAAAMVASREYREFNLRARGSESEEEIINRLNLGDGHVAIAMLMAGREDFATLINDALAVMITTLLHAVRSGQENRDIEVAIADFTRSQNVVTILKELATYAGEPLMDSLLVLDETHRTNAETPVVETKFFDAGVDLIRQALETQEVA